MQEKRLKEFNEKLGNIQCNLREESQALRKLFKQMNHLTIAWPADTYIKMLEYIIDINLLATELKILRQSYGLAKKEKGISCLNEEDQE